VRNSRKTPRIAAAAAVIVAMVMAFAALGGVGLAQTTGGPGGKQYGKGKVTICHKGKRTVRISKAAVRAHLRHGDTLGTCAEARKARKHKGHKGQKPHKGSKAHEQRAEKSKSSAKQKAAHPGKGKRGGKG
jgi:hypothetical protein